MLSVGMTAAPKADAILALGRMLASHTSAPPDPSGKPPKAPLDMRALQARGARLPYPTEEVMHRGALAFATEPEDIGEISEVQTTGALE